MGDNIRTFFWYMWGIYNRWDTFRISCLKLTITYEVRIERIK